MLKTVGCVKPMRMEDGWWGINKTEELVWHTRGGGWLDGKIAMHTTYRCMPTDDIIVLIINLLLPLH